MTNRKVIMVFRVILGIGCIAYIQSWIWVKSCWPSEQVHLKLISPEGDKIAVFSIRYQTVHPLIPSDVEPYEYLTILDAKTGQVLLRKTECEPSFVDSFKLLSNKFAPWAESQIELSELKS